MVEEAKIRGLYAFRAHSGAPGFRKTAVGLATFYIAALRIAKIGRKGKIKGICERPS
jgi:hypothetical protein